MKRIPWWLLMILIGFISYLLIRCYVVPTRELPNSEWFGLNERQADRQMTVDDKLQRMIRHAEIDSLINPAGGYRRLYFDRAWRAEPNDVYLMFGVSSTDVAVIYSGSLENGQLFWKAVESESP
jgi:hypothetical protein